MEAPQPSFMDGSPFDLASFDPKKDVEHLFSDPTGMHIGDPPPSTSFYKTVDVLKFSVIFMSAYSWQEAWRCQKDRFHQIL
jgi:hypothetical protein